MSRLNASALVALVLAFGLCGGFSAVSSAQEKPAKQNGESAYERIMAALDGPTEMEFIETPLKDVVDALKILHGIEIQLDSKAITDAGGTLDVPITESLKGISLRSALRLMLHEHELDFALTNEVLLITSAESPYVLRQYEVADLLSEGESIDSLAEVVRFAMPRASAPATKSNASQPSGNPAAPAGLAAGGGLGGGAPDQASNPEGEVITYGTLLLVRASDRGQMNVNTLLEEMRHRRKSAQHKPAQEAARQSHPQSLPPATGRGERAVSVATPNQ
jgi:hypothetical protein